MRAGAWARRVVSGILSKAPRAIAQIFPFHVKKGKQYIDYYYFLGIKLGRVRRRCRAGGRTVPFPVKSTSAGLA